MFDYERYGIKVRQGYKPADGSQGLLIVVDVTTYQECGDVVVHDYMMRKKRRIDAFKLAMVRYCLIDPAAPYAILEDEEWKIKVDD